MCTTRSETPNTKGFMVKKLNEHFTTIMEENDYRKPNDKKLIEH